VTATAVNARFVGWAACHRIKADLELGITQINLEKNMADIFIPWQMNELTIPNRIVRSATWEGLAEPDGTPTQETALLTAGLAEGGVGLIITGFAYVSANGKTLAGQTGVHIDAMVGPLTRISDAVHKSGGLVALQIAHAGGQGTSKVLGHKPLGPSAMVNPASQEEVKELSKAQIEDVVEDFAVAAARAKAAGFDAVQLHGAHGYLLAQFLSPFTNRRQDEYGGDAEGRSKLAWQVYREVRGAVGPRYPVFIKLNSTDAIEGGITLEDALVCAKGLVDAGIDAIEVSGGVPYAGKLSASRLVKQPADEGYFLDNAKTLKAAVGCPIIVVGGWRSRKRIEDALDHVDAVAMSRPLVRQPDLPNLWKAGSRQPADCISCGGCFVTARKGHLQCQVLLKESENE
jgi:2,4-dienoyl-CoA reductase-like NADH-dependent reductase (Old Yellow Enzyme family)